MKKETEICFLIDTAFVICLVGLIAVIGKFVAVFWPFTLAVFLSFVFKSLSDTLKNKLGVKNKKAVIISTVIFYAFLSFLLAFILIKALDFLTLVKDELPYLMSNLSHSLKRISERFANGDLKNSKAAEVLSSSINEFVKIACIKFAEAASEALKSLPQITAGLIFTSAASFYMASEMDSLISILKVIIPIKFHFFFYHIENFFKNCILKILKAYLIIGFITFIILSAGLYILKVKGFIKTAFVISLLDILPLLGTGGILIPWGIFALIKGDALKGWGLILLFLFIAVVRNILEPRIIGRELGLNPLLSLFAVFAGLKLMGLKGIIIFPLIFLFLKYFFIEKRLKEQ